MLIESSGVAAQTHQRPLKLFVLGKTRWHSTLAMLERALRLKVFIIRYLTTCPLSQLVKTRQHKMQDNDNLKELCDVHLDVTDWQTAKEMVRVLSVVRAKSHLLESSTRVTASLVLPCLMDLLYNNLPELPRTKTGISLQLQLRRKY